MKLPEGYAARPVVREDLDAIVELTQACDLHAVGFADPSRGEILEDWGRVGFEPERDARVVALSDGTVVAYANVMAYDPTVQMFSWAQVHPMHRGLGIGGELLDWIELHARARLIERAPVPLRNGVVSVDRAAGELLRRHGFAHVRSFWQMEKRLSADDDAGPAPKGITIRTSVAGDDDRAVFQILDDSFREHFGYVEYTFVDWLQEFRNFTGYDPSLVLLAMAAEEPVGVTVALIDEDIGWIAELGVRADWRGRGIGRALLGRGFTALAARGVTDVRLGVDTANATGATHLYESAGMSVRREWHTYEKSISRD